MHASDSPPPSPDGPGWLSPRGWSSLFLLMLLGVLPGLLCLDAPLLLGYDDKYITVDNPMIVHGLGYFFDQFMLPFRAQNRVGFDTPHWAPLSYLSLALDHKIFGMNPTAFRVISGLLHGVCGWFVYRLAAKLMWRGQAVKDAGGQNVFQTGRQECLPHHCAAPLIVALIFLFHPTVCESVCWIIERNNILPMLFGVWALDVYTGPLESGGRTAPGWGRVAAAFGLLLLSQLCKASGVCWWPIMAAWDFFLMPGAPVSFRAVLQKIVSASGRWAVLGLPVALSVFAIMRSHADVLMEPIGAKPFGPWLMWIYLTIRYVGLMAFPFNLSAFYHVSPAGVPWSDPSLWLACAGIAASVWWARRVSMPWAKIVFYAFWIAMAVAPIVNPFVTTAYLFQDRYVYPAMPAFACFGVEVVFETLSRFRVPRPVVFAALIPALLLPPAMSRARVWRSRDALFRDAVIAQPASAFTHCYLAELLFHSAKDASAEGALSLYRESAEQYDQALRCDDYDRQQWPLQYKRQHATILYEFLGQREKALQLCLEIVKGRAERESEHGAKAYAMKYLAADALQRGRTALGLTLLEEGLRIAPDDPDFLRFRLMAWKELNKTDEIAREAKRLRARGNLDPQLAEWLKQVPE